MHLFDLIVPSFSRLPSHENFSSLLSVPFLPLVILFIQVICLRQI